MSYLLKEDGYKLLLETGYGILLDTPLTISAQVTNSDYKWLSSTLKTAQQNSPYTPQYNLKILDDSLNPHAILTSPTVPVLGDATTSPDGYVLCAGGDGSGNLKFWKLSDASQTFPTGTTLVSSGSGYVSTLNTSIACSDWINGNYNIDVYFFYLSAGSYYPALARSVNGGSTWSINPYSVPAGFTGLNTGDNNYIAAGQPIYDPVQMVTKSTCFYIRGHLGASSAFYKVCYLQFDGGFYYGAEVQWPLNVDSQDWTIHSLDVQYLNGSFFIFFAGFHNWFETPSGNKNYSIYMAQLNNLTGLSSSDQWQLPVEILTSTSPQVTNNNAFKFPRITTDGNTFYLVFSALVGEGLTTSNTTTSQIGTVSNPYYYMMQSANLIDFSYPLPLYFTDGTVYADTAGVSFVNQGANYFLLGNGKNWQYIRNNIVADITNYVISYQIQEVSGQSSQIVFVLGNANNYWIGAGATGVGNTAIAVNKKIILEQGYKTSVGKEVAPRSVFYIDTITLNSSSSDNTATIQGRDINRNLQNVSTKFSYSLNGPSYFNDLFDGTTLQNWTQTGGTWVENNISGFGALTNNAPSGQNVISQGQINNNLESCLIFTMMNPTATNGSSTDIYPLYQDNGNYFQISVVFDNSTGFHKMVFNLYIGNVFVASLVNSLGFQQAGRFPILIRKYNYNVYDILVGKNISGGGSYVDNVLDPAGPFAPFSIFTVDLSQYFSSSAFLVNGSVALGTTGSGASGDFSPFKFMQFSESLSLQESLEYLCAIAGITNFDPRITFFDNQYVSSNWNGTYAIQNSYMGIGISQVCMNTSNPVLNGQIEFTAQVNPVVSGNPFGFNFIFRSTSNSVPNNGNYYTFVIKELLGVVVVALFLVLDNVNIELSQSSLTGSTNLIPIDLTKQHIYNITMIDQIFYLFIDGRVYMMWQDTNLTTQLNSIGYWGIVTGTNSVVIAGNFTSYQLYTQLPNVSFNPGDDMTSILQNVLETMFAYSYTDQMGRYIGITLNSTDPSNYTYQNLLYAIQSQLANSSLVNEVVVIGSGVIATYKDTALIAALGQVRSINITDYTITTYQDALTRAKNELISNNAVSSQNDPNNPMNVGSEMFDVITLINTGNNSTSINGNYRVFNQTFSLDGSKGKYSIQIETGNL